MTKQTEEALKMAIEALDRVAEYLAGDEQFNFDIYKIDKAYLTCKEALALSEKQHTFPDKKQPAQEPVGYIVPDYQNVMHARDGHTLMAQEKTDLHKIPVYTHPAPPAQEPVAWTTDTQMKWLSDASNNTSIMWNKNNWSQMGIKDNENIIPLYTHPAQPAQEPINLKCKSVQKRLATQWGYVKERPAQEPVAWKHFDKAYSKACNSSQPQDWMDAALLAQQARNTHPAPVCKCEECGMRYCECGER